MGPKSKINNQITSGNFISDISDHFSNFIIVDIELKKTMERPLIRLFTKKNTEKFKQNLSAEFADINEHINLQDNPNVNEIYKILYEKLISLLDLYFPKIRLSHKKAKDKNWITIGIKNAIKHRNQLYKIKIKDESKENVNNWKNYKNNCIGLWKTLGKIISKKNKQTTINNLKINNTTINDPEQIANTINDFFVNIGPKLASKFKNRDSNSFLKFMGDSSEQSMY